MPLTTNLPAPSASEPATRWQAISPAMATALRDARLQLHHAAQLAPASGISYLRAEADDSHTNLEWIASLAVLASRELPTKPAVRVAIRPRDLTVMLLEGGAQVASLALHSVTIERAGRWLSEALAEHGLDPRRFTLKRHFVIPTHPVGDGAPFDTSTTQPFAEIARWFANADEVLRSLAAEIDGATPVRCWPHHFDIATLIALPPAAGTASRAIGVGLEPGDRYYEQPYWYVNPQPQPAAKGLPTLEGGGHWHTEDWIGAVLPGDRLSFDAGEQQRQTIDFLRSAIDSCRHLLGA